MWNASASCCRVVGWLLSLVEVLFVEVLLVEGVASIFATDIEVGDVMAGAVWLMVPVPVGAKGLLRSER